MTAVRESKNTATAALDTVTRGRVLLPTSPLWSVSTQAGHARVGQDPAPDWSWPGPAS